MEKEILRSEDNLRDDDDDDLPSPTPSDEEMDEYRLRMADVETQSTGSQHRIKPRIVAEKVEVDIWLVKMGSLIHFYPFKLTNYFCLLIMHPYCF